MYTVEHVWVNKNLVSHWRRNSAVFIRDVVAGERFALTRPARPASDTLRYTATNSWILFIALSTNKDLIWIFYTRYLKVHTHLYQLKSR